MQETDCRSLCPGRVIGALADLLHPADRWWFPSGLESRNSATEGTGKAFRVQAITSATGSSIRATFSITSHW